MQFSKSKGESRDFESEFNELTARIENSPRQRGPRDYELAEPEEHFYEPDPDPLPNLWNRRAISLMLAVALIITLSGLGIAQVVLPVWGRIVFGVGILVCLAIGFYPQRK